MTEKEIQKIIDDISYKNYQFKLGNKNGTLYLQVIFLAPDNYTGEVEPQFCRKWQLSKFMVKSEVVRTAYKAVLAAEEHEVGEHFKYKDKLIFCPHVDVEALLDIAGRVDIRD